MPGKHRFTRLSAEARVGILGVALIMGWSLIVFASSPVVPQGMVVPDWWLLAVVLLLTELWVFRLQVGKEEQTISISELPLVVGMFTLHPASLLLARVVSTLTFLLYRRASPLKLVVNLGLAGAGVTLGTLAFHAVADGAAPSEPRAWAAALVATSVMAELDYLAITAGIAAFDRWPPLREVLRSMITCLALPAAATVAGLASAWALSYGSRAVPPLLLGFAIIIVIYRAYTTLANRHSSLTRLFDLSGDLYEARSVDEVAAAALTRATELLQASDGEFFLVRDGDSVSRWRVQGKEMPVLTRWSGLDGAHGVQPDTTSRRRHSIGSDSPAVAHVAEGAEGRHPITGAELWAWAQREGEDLGRRALAVPLVIAEGFHGLIVIGERAGEWGRQRDANRRLLEMVANQATVALRHVHALQRLTFEAEHDQLTGLLNRASFQREARATLRQVIMGRRPAVGVLDLDGFKTLNDSFGHHAGDIVIAEVGRRMSTLCDDKVLISRIGGDEFALLIRDSADDDEVIGTGRAVLACLSEDVVVDGRAVRISGSLGLAVAPRDGVSADAVMRCADFAMYAAKRGSGGIAVFGREIGHAAGDPVALAADLRLALARGEVGVAVQPLVDLSTGALHSVEVLARWRHAGLGSVEPESFVAAAERGGLTDELTRTVLDAALRACRSWVDEGLEVRVAVNLSARAIDDAALPDRVEAALRAHGVPGRLLSLELTEGGILDNPDRVRPVLHRLRELGVRLAIDDFGTGYSSMTYVSWLAPDQVKIDKTFVQRLALQGRDAAIVRSIIDLGHNLGVEVVAEGVSDPATARAVEELGCGLAQGFLYAEPMPWQALPAWVRRWSVKGAMNGATAGEGQADPPEDGGSERLRLVR